MNPHTYLVVMAGGIGSRFWPFSRTQHPKQFHDVLGVGRSMLQLTIDRFRGICPVENILVVTNRDYTSLVQQHLPELAADQILGEPIGRNTAPCIAYASYRIAQRDPNAVIIVTPADHAVFHEDVFQRVIRQAAEAAREHNILITLGIQPSRADTGYGYIQFLDEDASSLGPLKKVKTFTEKPNPELAQMFLDSGDFLWNSGLFVWRAEVILHAFHQYLSDIAEVFDEGQDVLGTPQEEEFIAQAYTRCRNISIDYGVMEKADNVYVLPADFGWSDLGTWDSLHRMGHHDAENNVVDGNALLYDTKECVIKTPSERLVVVQGLEGYIVAEYDNVLLICKRTEEQRVKDFVADVKSKKGTGYN
ncbi:mannose-1-phosphate guanylyltransferase [Hymenobacter lutimineralis]|uniref:mannose-1-phosphate guanylyltransferase n=1 Tax=Hymenobacter lutimineralis TaxID=2606448 RepID=A0A5D6V1Y6_9BACT|nr:MULTISPECIES: mannose-1-phosphate guanylyltransferase [Hymenobacter]QIX60928.1 mannose-1-phosphate guanylyltransferase [Hymenobacter sp. BT18]TYZ09566.1 mannose-1-phosphate guanylyltransferase [Hymenobacter lutimineralis]